VLEYLHVIFWFVFIEMLGLISMPLAGIAGNRLADGGYSAARALGILLVTYMAWLSSYILGFNLSTILISVLLLCLISITVYRKQRILPEKKILLSNELVFAAGFFFFLLVRIYLPEIYRHEKFMDFAFLNAVMRASSFPPADPWFAGGSLEFYYYFGYLSVGVPGKLFSVEPSMLFNLAIALTFALSFNLLFGFGYNLTHGKIRYGILTAFSVILLGNLQGLKEFISLYVTKETVPMGYYWSSSRVIPYTINEFPYFSFIHGDLHSHMLAIPFQLLVLALLLNIYLRKDSNRVFENVLALIIFSVSLGFLFPCNSWDFPIYFGLTFAVILAFYCGHYLRNKSLSGSVTGFLGTILPVSILSLLPYLSFYLSFKPQAAGGFDFVPPELRTTTTEFLILFSLFLFLTFSFLMARLKSKRKVQYLILLIGISAFLAREWSVSLLVILLPLLALSLYSFLKDLPERSNAGFVSLLIAVAAFITLFCEIIFLDDPISGSFARMNTVFKFYMHLWLFLAIAASYSYYQLNLRYRVRTENSLPLNRIYGKKVWTVSLVLLVLSCSIFPVVATFTRIEDMNAKPALDGMEYMKGLDRGDYDAIKWIQENIRGTPVILEASADDSSYRYTSRVSANTGLPTVIGWARHEQFWGRDSDEVRTRLEDVNSIYSTGSKEKALELMNKYNVSYVYIGQLERQMYNIKTDKFGDETYFELVYQGSVRIYKVKKEF
jgi:YYY domain-containing protein